MVALYYSAPSIQYTPQWTLSRRHRYNCRGSIHENVLGLGLDRRFPSVLSTVLLSSEVVSIVEKCSYHHKIQHTPVILINNSDSSTILPSNLRTGQEIRIFYCKFRAWPYIIRDNVSLGTPAELVPFWHIFHFTIFELSSQNRNFNSLLCEIFTNLAVKVQKSGI